MRATPHTIHAEMEPGDKSPPKQHTRKRSLADPGKPRAERRVATAAVATDTTAVTVSIQQPRQLADGIASSSASDMPSSAVGSTPPGVRLYFCGQCQKRFRSPAKRFSKLAQHERVHTTTFLAPSAPSSSSTRAARPGTSGPTPARSHMLAPCAQCASPVRQQERRCAARADPCRGEALRLLHMPEDLQVPPTGSGGELRPCPGNTAALIFKRFAEKNKVVPHERTHTGEKPHACSMCPTRFSQKNDVPPHERTHTGEKPYGCSVCPRRFSQKGNLARHERTHTGEKPYACSMCPMRFSDKSHVAPHERTHTGEKPCACSMCPRRFTNKSAVAPHARTHTGEKP